MLSEQELMARQARMMERREIRKAVRATEKRCDECEIPLSYGTKLTYLDFAMATIQNVTWQWILQRVAFYCDVCFTMQEAVRRQPGLHRASIEWNRENEKLAKKKKRMVDFDSWYEDRFGA